MSPTTSVMGIQRLLVSKLENTSNYSSILQAAPPCARPARGGGSRWGWWPRGGSGGTAAPTLQTLLQTGGPLAGGTLLQTGGPLVDGTLLQTGGPGQGEAIVMQ